MRQGKNQIDYDFWVNKHISVIRGKYWYLPFIQKEIAKVLRDTRPDKQKSYEALKQRVEDDLKHLLTITIPTIQDEVDLMFGFLAMQCLGGKIFASMEIGKLRAEFSNLRTVRGEMENPTIERTLRMRNLILKFYSCRYVPTLCN